MGALAHLKVLDPSRELRRPARSACGCPPCSATT